MQPAFPAATIGRVAWLAAAPTCRTSDDAVAIVAVLARRIAQRLDCPAPTALESSATESPGPTSGAVLWVDGVPAEALTPDLLGEVWEVLLRAEVRREHGAHFTPRSVAESVCSLAVEYLSETSGPVTTFDPAVGGGAFLLAAARTLEGRGLDRASIVRQAFGFDIDPGAVRVADAALELWCRGEARPTLAVVDTLRVSQSAGVSALGLDSGTHRGFDLVVGNPPFLGQLTADTSRDAERRAQLVDRFGAAAKGYVDEAGLFLLASMEYASDGGVVAMLVPQSLLAAADTNGVRRTLAAADDLRALWIDTDDSFTAAVRVAALVLGGHGPPALTTVVTNAVRIECNTPAPGSWARLLGTAAGVPPVSLTRAVAPDEQRPPEALPTLGSIATVTAGFRQHFYGLADAVVDAPAADDPLDPTTHPKLITSGAIDPLWVRWGERPVKFAKRSWTRPVVDLDSIADDTVRTWFRQRCRPKLLVASQTRVIEAIVDTDGEFVPSVPVISVEPRDPRDLWALAAYLTAPIVSAHMAAEHSGSGLGAGSIRVRASTLAQLPLGQHHDSAHEVAPVAEAAWQAANIGDRTGHRNALRRLGRALTIDECDEAALEWWWSRLRFPAR